MPVSVNAARRCGAGPEGCEGTERRGTLQKQLLNAHVLLEHQLISTVGEEPGHYRTCRGSLPWLHPADFAGIPYCCSS